MACRSLELLGRAWSEPLLIKLAYGYEQATRHRDHPPAHPRSRGREGRARKFTLLERLLMSVSLFLRVVGLVTWVILTASSSALAQEPRAGGWLNLRLREDLPQGFAIHESPTISTMWPAMPCLSNLVLFDPRKPTHSVDTVIGDCGTVSWQENFRKLVFFLRRDVKWHDGKPFTRGTSSDVRHAPGDRGRAGQAASQPAEGMVRQRRGGGGPRSADRGVPAEAPAAVLLLMLASGYTPIYAATCRRRATHGMHRTGPFKLKEWRKGEFVEYVKNPSTS